MGIITLRLNEDEEKMLERLQEAYDLDKSKIIKEAMLERFEELRDRDIIEGYESKLHSGKVEFESADSLLKELENKGKKANRKIIRPANKSSRTRKKLSRGTK